MTEPQMPYYEDPRFHAAMSAIPAMQIDQNGDRVARIGTRLFKKVQGQIVHARVPRDLGFPSAWEPLPGDDLVALNAASMLPDEVVAPPETSETLPGGV
jgi:hypothetical protein